MKSMHKSIIWLILFVAIMIAGCIISFTVEIGTGAITTSFNPDAPLITKIGAHVGVVMLFFVVAAAFLFMYLHTKSDALQMCMKLTLIGAFLVSGLFFAIATGCMWKSNVFSDYYYRMINAPQFYSGDVIGTKWFIQLPLYAEMFQMREVGMFILAFLTAIATVGVYFLFLRKSSNKYANLHIRKACPYCCTDLTRYTNALFCPYCGKRLL